MSFKLGILGTGSSANSYVLQEFDRSVMIDNGFSLKETLRRMNGIHQDPRLLRAILMTHDHQDHTRGVCALSRKFSLPVFIPRGMGFESSQAPEKEALKEMSLFQETRIAGFQIFGFNTLHDVKVSAGYSIKGKSATVTIITDTGNWDDTMIELARHSDVLVLESNFSGDMLWAGSYPIFLKQRVAQYHLSNLEAGRFLAKLSRFPNRIKEIVLVHLSSNNNTPERVLAEVTAVLQQSPWASIPALVVQNASPKTPSGRTRLWVLPKNASWCYTQDQEVGK